MKIKRIIALLLVAVLAFSMVGCSGEKEQETEEVPVISWYIPGEPSSQLDLVMEEINKLIEPKIGAKLELVVIDDGAYEQRMNMMMTADEEWDICFTANWVNKFLPNVAKDAYLPLDELIKEYAPGLNEVVPEYAWNASRVKEQIYAVPNMQMIFNCFAVCMMKELTDKYNFDVDAVEIAHASPS